MDRKDLSSRLDACLLTEAEMAWTLPFGAIPRPFRRVEGRDAGLTGVPGR
jgi:hypothetical protein